MRCYPKVVFIFLFAISRCFGTGNIEKFILDKIPNVYKEPIQEMIKQQFINKEELCFTQLDGGLSAASLFLLDFDQNKYVLRLIPERQQPEKTLSEINAHQVASEIGITPRLLYTDNKNLVLMEYINGRNIKNDDLNDENVMIKIMEAIKLYHYIPNPPKTLCTNTKLDTINQLYTRYKEKGVVFPSGYEELLKKITQIFKTFNTPFAPSHGDFNPGNILISKDDKIYLIDWPHAAIDNPYLDLGWFACFTAANKEQIAKFLSFYLDRKPTTDEIKEVLFFKNMTNFLMATLLIGRQEEREQQKLDEILNSSIKMPSQYIKEGIKLDIRAKKGREFTEYALGWLKEFIENQ